MLGGQLARGRRLGLLLLTGSLAATLVGCPESKAERAARIAESRAQRQANRSAQANTPGQSAGAQAPRPNGLKHVWPPSYGQPHPDLVMFDLEGEEVRLSRFKGKVIVLHYAATTSPGSVSQTGGPKWAPFQGTAPQPGVWRLDKELAEGGVPIRSPDLAVVQILFYGPNQAVPTKEDAQAWVKHFKFAEGAGPHVFYADARYQLEETRAMIPGYTVIGRNFQLLYDRTGLDPPHRFTEVVQGLKKRLNKRRQKRLPAPPAPSPTTSARWTRVLALGELLKQGDHAALSAKVDEIVAQGYRKDEPGRTHLDAIDDLHAVPGVKPRHFDAWVESSSESFAPAYLRGMAHVKWGWKARGHGWASTVTEEGWRIFGEELDKARLDFTLANRISSSQAYGYTGLLIVARATSAPENVREAYFRAAIQADPDYLAAYLTKLEAIYPKWGGTAREAMDFVYDSVGDRPEYLPLLRLIPSLHYEFSRTVVENGKDYLNKPSVVKDCANAFKQLRKAYPKSRQVNRLALKIAERGGRDIIPAATILRDLKDPWGMGRYACALKWGRHGLKRDVEAALPILVYAGNAGDALACSEVAHALIWDKEVTHDTTRAVAWLKRAAPSNEWSKEQLGDSYFEGRGVPKDLVEATKWYRRADTKRSRKQLGKIARLLAKQKSR